MHSLINLFKSYFNKFNEKTLKSNFVIIYELLDEVCDNGYPQITSPEVLKAFITQRAARAADDPKDTYENQRKAKEVSMQVTGAVQWRGQNLVYKKNEVYLDIVESVSLLMSPKGVVLKASATGTIEMKTALSGAVQPQKEHRPRRPTVSPVRQPVQVRVGEDHLVRAARRQVRPDEVPRHGGHLATVQGEFILISCMGN
jgi:hypothetical protein